VGGVEPQSLTVWRQAEKYQVPSICFVNKMDRTGADFFDVVRKIQEELGGNAVPIVLPVGKNEDFAGLIDLVKNCEVRFHETKGQLHVEERPIPEAYKDEAHKWRKSLIEKVSEQDDHLLEKFVAGHEPTEAEIRAALRKATLTRGIHPVLCGSAARNIGIQRLLDAVIDYLPAPKIEEGPLAALAFKIFSDRHNKLTYVRVYKGTLNSGSYVLNSRVRQAGACSRRQQPDRPRIPQCRRERRRHRLRQESHRGHHLRSRPSMPARGDRVPRARHLRLHPARVSQ
jgi:elongation factor G